MKKSSNVTARYRQVGLSLIEVLIALIILAIGLLGTAAMQTLSMESTVNANYRSVALYMANDLIDRIRANPVAHENGHYDSTAGAVLNSACTTSTGCTPAEMAKNDVQEWLNGLSNKLPSGTGTITRGTGDAYVITVSWRERVKKAASEAAPRFETATISLTLRP